VRPRWFGYELIRFEPAALEAITAAEVEAMGEGLASWGEIDAYARLLAGPAWLAGALPDEMIGRWAASPDRWRRRSALVSTVALNSKVDGGAGDAPRTLAVCEALAGDGDDMVVKALSWALRALSERDPGAVRAFLERHEEVLAARVRREVSSKLATGLKSPRRR
jgi:3-methyladenine DNA glycosylase AlkD